MKLHNLTLALASAGLMTACGGGGGSSTNNSDTPPAVTAPAANATVSLSGVASKGLMANADVKVYAVKADGTVDDSAALASTTTDATGKYTLNFSGTKDQPYVVKVSAKADGSTTHLDEVSGVAKSLPAGFTMRAIVTPAATGDVTTSATVTPFSEMAVSAATKSTGGITKDNAAQAISTVTQLLGFDPTTVSVKKTDDGTASADEKKLAIMLTAVSQMSSTGALGCSTGDDGAKTKCVVEKLSASASASSIELKNGNDDVAAALKGAVTFVVDDSTLNGGQTAADLSAITGNLGCAATNSCAAAAPVTVGGIASVKAMLAQLKSDWMALFSSTATSANAVQTEAQFIKDSLMGVQLPADVWAKDMGAIILGTDLYRRAKDGSSTRLSVGRGQGLVTTDSFNYGVGESAIGCTLYQDEANNTPATSAANANFIGCSARYFVHSTVNGVTGVMTQTQWRHGFTITPKIDGSFGYTTRARKSTFTSSTGGPQTRRANVSLPSGVDTDVLNATAPLAERFAGTYSPTVTAGKLLGFSLKGDLPAAFDYNVNPDVNGNLPLVNQRHAIDFSGSATTDVSTGAVTASASGSIQAYAADGTTVNSTFAISKGAINYQPTVNAAGLKSVDLALNWVTAGARFDGSLQVIGVSTDVSGTQTLPSRVALNGALSSIHTGVATKVLSGEFAASQTGYASFDATKPASSTNFFSASMAVTAEVSAPSRPRLVLSLGVSGKKNGGSGPDSVTAQYKSYGNGSATAPTQTVNVVVTPPASGVGKASVVLTDNTNGFKVRANGDAGTVDVVTNDAAASKIADFDKSKKLLTFIDGSSLSLDFGL